MKKLIAIADWAADALAREEFEIATAGFLQSDIYPFISYVPTTPSTLHVSYLTNQLVETTERYGRPLDTVIFVESDQRVPLENEESARPGEFFILRLFSGLYVCGPNSGYTFSMLKSRIDRAFSFKMEQTVMQNRARDLYSRQVAYLLEALQDDLELDEVHTNLIPEINSFFVGHIDLFGTIKTNILKEEVKGHGFGSDLSITLNGITQRARLVEHLFAGKPDELVIYPGSSGNPDNPFLEISVWQKQLSMSSKEERKTALHLFNNPTPGMKITIL